MAREKAWLRAKQRGTWRALVAGYDGLVLRCRSRIRCQSRTETVGGPVLVGTSRLPCGRGLCGDGLGLRLTATGLRLAWSCCWPARGLFGFSVRDIMRGLLNLRGAHVRFCKSLQGYYVTVLYYNLGATAPLRSPLIPKRVSGPIPSSPRGHYLLESDGGLLGAPA